jgi:phage baseplate assembly protein gpV
MQYRKVNACVRVVEVQQLDHAARRHRRLGDVARRPGHVVVRVGLVEAVDAAQRVVRVRLDQAGLAGVVHHQQQAALGRGHGGLRIAGGEKHIVPAADFFVAQLQFTFHHKHFEFGPAEARLLAVAGVELHGDRACTGVGVQAQHLVMHAAGKALHGHLLEGNVAVAERFDMWACHGNESPGGSGLYEASARDQ